MMNVTLFSYTHEPEKIVAAAAKLCYSESCIEDLLEGLTEEKTVSFLNRLSNLGHSSPTEHAVFTFGIEGISRACLAQLTRHRIASYSVKSQRYVNMDDFKYVIPPEIENSDPKIKKCFIDMMENDAKLYQDLVNELTYEQFEDFDDTVYSFEDFQRERGKAQKKSMEDARFVLPNACETSLVMTINARSLNNFFELRCCNRAQWEIRILAEKMFELVYEVAPNLFSKSGPSCVVTGHCTEGNMSCGKCNDMKEKYGRMKNKSS